MITSETIITLNPDYVEFRTPTNFGCQVVKVFTQLETPRFMAFGEWVTDGQRLREPLSLPLDEIVSICKQAWDVSHRTSTLVTALQDVLGKASKEQLGFIPEDKHHGDESIQGQG